MGKCGLLPIPATDYIGTRTVDQYYIGSRLYKETMKDNLSEVDIQGVEAEMKYDFGHGLTANFNYTYNLSKIAEDEVDQSLEGNYVSVPRGTNIGRA